MASKPCPALPSNLLILFLPIALIVLTVFFQRINRRYAVVRTGL